MAWAVTAFLVGIFWLRDAHQDWAGELMAGMQRVLGLTENQFPVLDSLRHADSPVPDLVGNLPVRVIGFSFALAGAKCYQNLYSGITPLVGVRTKGLGARAVLAEAFMRLFTFIPAILILPPNIVERRWWPVLVAIGITFTFLCNFMVLPFARRAIRLAQQHKLSTVPDGEDAGLESFKPWTYSSLYYSIVVWSIAMPLTLGLLHDELVYALGAASINVVLFYIIKCGLQAGEVRVGLTRACLAAERLSRVERLPAGPTVPEQRPDAAPWRYPATPDWSRSRPACASGRRRTRAPSRRSARPRPRPR
jgi:hypothetical protein